MKATFKRDYARVNPLLDAATVLQQIAGSEDCNESHPHSCLGMSSPREFFCTHLAEVSGHGGNTTRHARRLTPILPVPRWR
jgi:hypothetical protein